MLYIDPFVACCCPSVGGAWAWAKTSLAAFSLVVIKVIQLMPQKCTNFAPKVPSIQRCNLWTHLNLREIFWDPPSFGKKTFFFVQSNCQREFNLMTTSNPKTTRFRLHLNSKKQLSSTLSSEIIKINSVPWSRASLSLDFSAVNLFGHLKKRFPRRLRDKSRGTSWGLRWLFHYLWCSSGKSLL